MEVVEFPLSRQKSFLNMSLLLSIICLGVFLVYISVISQFNLYSFLPLVEILLYTVVLLFLAIIYLKRFFKNKIGLRIDESGITDNSTSLRIGLIPWSDIVRIETIQEANIKMILVFVRNPDAYLSKVNKLTRMSLEMNLDKYDIPIFITATSLKCNFSELENAVRGWFNHMAERKSR